MEFQILLFYWKRSKKTNYYVSIQSPHISAKKVEKFQETFKKKPLNKNELVEKVSTRLNQTKDINTKSKL